MPTVPPLSFGAIPRPAFGSARQHADPATAPTGRHTTKADRRYARAAVLAADLIPTIPAPGEAVHALMTGRYNLCQVLTATCKLLPTLRRVRVSTLCFNKRNVSDLAALLDARGIGLTLLVSRFFHNHNKDGYAEAKTTLEAFPGGTVAYAKTHAKVVTFDTGDADGLVFEGSANLRANDSLEQLCVIRDRGLHDFHAAWIDAAAGGARGE